MFSFEISRGIFILVEKEVSIFNRIFWYFIIGELLKSKVELLKDFSSNRLAHVWIKIIRYYYFSLDVTKYLCKFLRFLFHRRGTLFERIETIRKSDINIDYNYCSSNKNANKKNTYNIKLR